MARPGFIDGRVGVVCMYRFIRLSYIYRRIQYLLFIFLLDDSFLTYLNMAHLNYFN